MKRKLLLPALLIFICCFVGGFILAQQQHRDEKTYTLQVTQSQLQILYYVIDKSTAEHTTVKEVAGFLNPQVEAQDRVFNDTTQTRH